jgi:hypothetical protein
MENNFYRNYDVAITDSTDGLAKVRHWGACTMNNREIIKSAGKKTRLK